MKRNNVLILFAHPAKHKSKVNRYLLNEVINEENVTVHELYEEYPDFQIDVKKEQSLLLEHDIIVWHHPLYWYSAPAIIKEWMDLVLEHNFAYGKLGNALAGKSIFNVVTAGGGKNAYCEDGRNCHTIIDFLLPYRQSANLCSMNYLPPYVVHGTHLLKEKEILTYAQDYKRTILALRDNLFDEKEIIKLEYLNDLIN